MLLLQKQVSPIPRQKILAKLTFKGTAIPLRSEIKTTILSSMAFKKMYFNIPEKSYKNYFSVSLMVGRGTLILHIRKGLQMN